MTNNRPHWYNGTPMASATEVEFARWCDRHGIKWLYETQAFNDGIGHWRPDFHLRHVNVSWLARPLDVFVEIKFGQWLFELDGPKRRMALNNFAAVYRSKPNAVVIIEQSGIINRPALVELHGEKPQLVSGKWVDGPDGRPMLARDYSDGTWAAAWWHNEGGALAA